VLSHGFQAAITRSCDFQNGSLFCSYRPPKKCSCTLVPTYELYYYIVFLFINLLYYELYIAYKYIVIVINLWRNSHKRDKKKYRFFFLKFWLLSATAVMTTAACIKLHDCSLCCIYRLTYSYLYSTTSIHL